LGRCGLDQADQLGDGGFEDAGGAPPPRDLGQLCCVRPHHEPQAPATGRRGLADVERVAAEWQIKSP